jgi:hypothetical protein
MIQMILEKFDSMARYSKKKYKRPPAIHAMA